MRIKSEMAINALEKANIQQVAKRVDELPESEVNGRTDWQVLADEASWTLYCYNDPYSALGEGYREAKKILRETKGGRNTLFMSTGSPLYKISDIKEAKDTINEYRRTVRFLERLNKLGVYGKWQGGGRT